MIGANRVKREPVRVYVTGQRRRAKSSIKVVGPGVIRAANHLQVAGGRPLTGRVGVFGWRDQLRAAMTTEVVVRVELLVGIHGDEHGFVKQATVTTRLAKVGRPLVSKPKLVKATHAGPLAQQHALALMAQDASST